MDKLQYQPLRPQPDGDVIRVLTLYPSQGDERPLFSLEVVKLDHPPPYEALSYCWGESSPLMVVECDGAVLSVFPNLYAALRQLGRGKDVRRLWIDAICIDQSNISERSYQVSLMNRVYRNAAKVVVWLGRAGDQSHLVFSACKRLWDANSAVLLEDGAVDIDFFGPEKEQRLREVLENARLRQQGEEANERVDQGVDPVSGQDVGVNEQLARATEEETKAFLSLVSRPYFTRCWVLQEIVLGREVDILCGDQSMSCNLFFAGFILLLYGPYALMGRPEQLLQSALILQMSLRTYYHHERAPRLGYVHRVDWILRKVIRLHATNSLDKIYSILGILDHDVSTSLNIKPDYKLTPQQCYHQTTMAILSSQRTLDVLLTDRHPDSALAGSLLSWVPDWSRVPGSSHPGIVSLARDDSYAQDGSLKFPPYQASTAPEFTPRFRTRSSSNDVLVLSGYTTDEIVQLTSVLQAPRLDYNTVSRINGPSSSVKSSFQTLGSIMVGVGDYISMLVEWDKLAMAWSHARYPTGESPERAFAMTMCTGNVKDSAHADEVYARFLKWRANLYYARTISKVKSLLISSTLTKSLFAITATISGAVSGPDRTFATATEPTLQRRLARTKKGYLAVVPAQSAVGDLVGLFAGGKTPFVIRKQHTGYSFEMMGPCYVHGIMAGEAWDSGRVRDIEIT